MCIRDRCMMWDTSPAATELEEKVTDWIRDAIGLPSNWKGVINDTASLGTISSLLTAREIKSNYDINENGFNLVLHFKIIFRYFGKFSFGHDFVL